MEWAHQAKFMHWSTYCNINKPKEYLVSLQRASNNNCSIIIIITVEKAALEMTKKVCRIPFVCRSRIDPNLVVVKPITKFGEFSITLFMTLFNLRIFWWIKISVPSPSTSIEKNQFRCTKISECLRQCCLYVPSIEVVSKFYLFLPDTKIFTFKYKATFLSNEKA